jgi:branched-chain amino acid transport system substrate-binding protein
VIRRFAVVVVVAMVAVACGQEQANQQQGILLGAVYPLSGPQAPGGKEELAGVQAALQVAESSGAPRITLKVIDATTPQAASDAVDSLVRDYHVPAILGTYGSTLSAAASSRAEELKTVYWETGAVADPITVQRRYVFRTVATGSALGRMAVNFTHDVLMPKASLASPRAVVVQVTDIYGESVGGGEQQLAQTLGINIVDVIQYNPNAFDPDAIATRVAQDRADILYDVSYLDDGVAIWQAVLRHHVPLVGAIGTSSAFCLPQFSQRLGAGSVGVYAADKPDSDVSPAALSAKGEALLTLARSTYGRANAGASMEIPGVAGFVGGWTLFHDVIGTMSGAISSDSIRAAALNVDVPVGDSINGGGVRFAGAGALDEGQNTRAAAVVGQWQSVGVMKVLYPAAYATGQPMTWDYGGM